MVFKGFGKKKLIGTGVGFSGSDFNNLLDGWFFGYWLVRYQSTSGVKLAQSTTPDKRRTNRF
jgi:hypothetical protein